MPRDINQVILEGNLGADPVVRIPASGKGKLVAVPLYTKFTKQNGTEIQVISQRHNLIFFGPAAEAAAEYKKGMRLHLEGRLNTRKYEDPDTKLDKYITEVVVSKANIVMRNAAGVMPAAVNS